MKMSGSSENEGKVVGSGEFANMPKETKMESYPKSNQFGPGVLNDTMSEIDMTTKKASSKSHRFLSNQH